MASILVRPRAKIDLAEIWEHIAEDSVTRADAFIETIGQKLQTLAEQPNMGRMRDVCGEGLRSFPVGRYVIFYRTLQNGIDVIRVLHGARDLEATLRLEE